MDEDCYHGSQVMNICKFFHITPEQFKLHQTKVTIDHVPVV